HGRQRLLEDASLPHQAAFRIAEAPAHLLEDPRIGPMREVLRRRALDVVAGKLARAQGEQREAAGVAYIDELLAHALRLHQQAEPGEGVVTPRTPARARRDAFPGNAVESVATRDDVADEVLLASVLDEDHLRPVALQIRQAHGRGLEPDVAA